MIKKIPKTCYLEPKLVELYNKIEEKKQAKSIFERLDAGKGRPKKYYELLFLDQDGELLDH